MGVHCPQVSAVKVSFGCGAQIRDTYLHANHITFFRASALVSDAESQRSERVVCAGQSPRAYQLCERFLVHGLDGGRGLLEFVSPRRHLQSGQADDNTVASQLRAKFAAANAACEALILGGRYHVTAIDRILGEQPDTFSLRVTATDLNHPGQIRSLILTQAGLKFDDKVLRVAEIERANALVGGHLEAGGFNSSGFDFDPMVVSGAGIGRNATLICYREALARLGTIRNESDLGPLLQEIIRVGRRDRGPRFIHSEAQFDELHKALLQQYRQRWQGASAAVPPCQSVAQHGASNQ